MLNLEEEGLACSLLCSWSVLFSTVQHVSILTVECRNNSYLCLCALPDPLWQLFLPRICFGR